MPSAPRSVPLDAGPFADQVMAAIAEMPLPTPTRSFASAVRGGAVRDAGSTVLVAWHLATVRSWRVAPRVRARSFALVFAVAAMLTTGSLATTAAVRVVAPLHMPHSRLVDRSGSNVPAPAAAAPTPSVSPEASPTAEPAEAPPAVVSPADPRGGSTSPSHPTDPIDGGNHPPGSGDGEPHEGSGGDPVPEATDDNHVSGDGDPLRSTPVPDHASGGDVPDASSQSDSGSDGGSAWPTSEPSGPPDGGGSGPDE